MQILRRNFGLKLISLVLAVVGWAYFRFANNPVTARFDQQLSVPITLVNVPVGFAATYTEKEAVVTVRPQPGVPAVKPDEIRAVIDLTRYRSPGVYIAAVTTVAPSGVVLQSLSPPQLPITLEKIEEKTFALAVHYAGQAAQQGVVVGNVKLTPADAVVRGASGALAQVTSVRVDVPLSARSPTLDEMIRPVPVNSLGQEVGGLQVSPDLVAVQAQVAPSTGIGAKH